MLKRKEYLVKDPDGVNPPSPAHPEDRKWNGERKDEELSKEVNCRFKFGHVDELEVSEVWSTPGEDLRPEEGSGLQEPSIGATPPIPEDC